MFISLGCLSIVFGKVPMSLHTYLCSLCIVCEINIQYGSKLVFPHSSHYLHVNVVNGNGMVTFTRNVQFGLVHT